MTEPYAIFLGYVEREHIHIPLFSVYRHHAIANGTPRDANTLIREGIELPKATPRYSVYHSINEMFERGTK